MSLVHGSRSTYSNRGCRCVACTAANTAFMRRVRQSLTLMPDDTRHGTVNAYTNYACRCEPCKAAKAAYEKDRAKQKEAH